MAIKCNSENDSYTFAEGEHKRWDILLHFGVRTGRADEIRQMLAEVHRRYYETEATPEDLWHWGLRYMSAEQELPYTVLAIYCKEKGLVPTELAKAS